MLFGCEEATSIEYIWYMIYDYIKNIINVEYWCWARIGMHNQTKMNNNNNNNNNSNSNSKTSPRQTLDPNRGGISVSPVLFWNSPEAKAWRWCFRRPGHHFSHSQAGQTFWNFHAPTSVTVSLGAHIKLTKKYIEADEAAQSTVYSRFLLSSPT